VSLPFGFITPDAINNLCKKMLLSGCGICINNFSASFNFFFLLMKITFKALANVNRYAYQYKPWQNVIFLAWTLPILFKISTSLDL